MFGGGASLGRGYGAQLPNFENIVVFYGKYVRCLLKIKKTLYFLTEGHLQNIKLPVGCARDSYPRDNHSRDPHTRDSIHAIPMHVLNLPAILSNRILQLGRLTIHQSQESKLC